MTNTRLTEPADPGTRWLPSRGLAAGALALSLAVVAAALGIMALGPGALLAYDSGLAGTPGRFTAAHCWQIKQTRGSSSYCEGSFTADDRSVTVPEVTLVNTAASLGRPLAVRREADGSEYAVGGVPNVCFDLALCLLILGMAGGAIVMLGALPRRLNRDWDLNARVQPWVGLMLTGVVVFPAGLVLAVLSCLVGVAAALLGRM